MSEIIHDKIRGSLRLGSSIKHLTWFNTGSTVDLLFTPKDIDDLQYFLANRPSTLTKSDIKILGAGTNILVRDEHLPSTVIRLGRSFNYINIDPVNTLIKCGASTLDSSIAMEAANRNIAGLEFLYTIPGTIGGALSMNAGAYGSDIAEILVRATALNKISGQLRQFTPADIGYGYRSRSLPDEWIFIDAEFRGNHAKYEQIMATMREMQEKRELSQPLGVKTGGSTFKNPINSVIKAWEIIDKLGLRGKIIGDAQISEKHCNFLINRGGATSDDIQRLIKLVQQEAEQSTGIKLETEIVFW